MPELSPELIAVLSAALGMLVAEGLRSLSVLVGRDLSGHYAAVTAAVVGLAVASVNGLLGLVPEQYIPLANGILAFLVVVLGPLAIHDFLQRSQRKATG